MDKLQIVALLAMFLSVAAVWVRSITVISLLLAVFAIAGIASSWIEPIFLVSAGILWGSAVWAKQSTREISRWIAHTVVIVSALALGTHSAPGYNPIALFENTRITELTGWGALTFQADKPLAGIIILSVFFRDRLFRSFQELREPLIQTLPIAITGALLVYTLGLAMGYVQFDWSPSVLIIAWFVRNLIFTVIAEEALFRGVILHGLAGSWTFRHGKWLALLVSSILFGAAHIAGGIEYVFLASLSGLVYGYVMMRTGKIEMAILAHLLLNTGNILFLSYGSS